MSSPIHKTLTFLDLIDVCDNVHLRCDSAGLYDSAYNSERIVPLHLSESPASPVIGLLRPAIIEQLVLENDRSRKMGVQGLWSLNIDAPKPSVSLRDFLDTPSKRTAAMKELCERWRDTGLFPDVCGPKKWRAEMYPIYADPFGVHDHPSLVAGHEDGLNYVFEMERSACALFGIVTYGVHMSIFDEVLVDGQRSLRVWVPTRAHFPHSFPGQLDNTVAGGIPSGMPIFESLLKECMEEASIEADVITKHARSVGSISYFFRTSKGWLQPEVEYVYDTVIPAGTDHAPFTPRPLDGEVESFEFVSHDRLLQQLHAGLFKPNCALVIIDLLVRFGYITPDNEPNFSKIINRLHGTFDYEKWGGVL